MVLILFFNFLKLSMMNKHITKFLYGIFALSILITMLSCSNNIDIAPAGIITADFILVPIMIMRMLLIQFTIV